MVKKEIPACPPDGIFAPEEKADILAEHCIECGECVKECAFLQRHGTPRALAQDWLNSDRDFSRLPYECSLCALCKTVCPLGLNPRGLFLDMRRTEKRLNPAPFPQHNRLLAYEDRGVSQTYTWWGVPENCDTVYFPGCTFAGTRPAATRELYAFLRRKIPSLGVVMDCCSKPSHDLGHEEIFHRRFDELKNRLIDLGIKRVLVNCPNCFRVFKRQGAPLKVNTVYKYLAENGTPRTGRARGTVVVHDPCPTREHPESMEAVRKLVVKMGATLEEMQHNTARTLCCGEGGAVPLMDKGIADGWGRLRAQEADGRLTIAACAGCVNMLTPFTPAAHVLDLVFFPAQTMAGKAKIAKAPMTYVHRLRLKHWFKKHVNWIKSGTREQDTE